jgi:putative endonuclease
VATQRAQQGFLAEERAAHYLREQGFTILARNFRCRTGELDIVARRQRLLVIAEVRMRSDSAYGGAGASITSTKQGRIRRAARYFLRYRPALRALAVRCDSLLLDRPDGPVEWIENAFS